MIHLTSAWTQEYQCLADLTWPGKKAYAERWGYTAKPFHHTNAPKVREERVQHWIDSVASVPKDQWVWFSGCDLMITNPAIDIGKYIDPEADIMGANDCRCINSDSLLMKHTKATLKHLHNVQQSMHMFNDEQECFNTRLSSFQTYKEFINFCGEAYGTFSLQVRLQHILNQNGVKFTLVPQKYFNTYSRKHIRHTLQGWCPTDGSDWEMGDFCLHMAGQTLQYRLKHFPKYIPNDGVYPMMKPVTTPAQRAADGIINQINTTRRQIESLLTNGQADPVNRSNQVSGSDIQAALGPNLEKIIKAFALLESED